MTVIVQSSPTRTAVVLDQSTVTAVRSGSVAVAATIQRTVNTVTDNSDTTNVASIGLRGLPGVDGEGDNVTFNDNLALLYSVAKA